MNKFTKESKKINYKTTDEVDEIMGFARYESGGKRIGWMTNMHTVTIADSAPGEPISLIQDVDNNSNYGCSAVEYYFIDEDGDTFKTTFKYDPYFLVACREGYENEVEEFLKRKLEGVLKSIERVVKEDLSIPNHLVGIRRKYLKIKFKNINNLLRGKKILMPIVFKNKSDQNNDNFLKEITSTGMEIYFNNINITDNEENIHNHNSTSSGRNKRGFDAIDAIVDIREFDVPYHVRVSIDCDLRVGKWYTVEANHGEISIEEIPERVTRPDPVVLAFDIETTKDPLKFPVATKDRIMMISYMIDGEGYLITNREIVSQDIYDFEYTPKPEYPGFFTIFNEENEKSLLERFFEHIRDVRPNIIVTFNGDFFDWPFVEKRANYHGINMHDEIGFEIDSESEYKSTYCSHMDAFRWVKRDSYLPQGSQGLKAVTTAKLGYNPIELDPELMTPYAYEKPQTLAEYSVSDAVATYYLYMKYIHPFIFSLCNIIPLNPDEVLRKGTGTLCEMLLMVQAYKGNIVFPVKHGEKSQKFYNGHLLESETYVGGHVESLESGVFRSDIPVTFKLDSKAFDELIDHLDKALKFSIEIENNRSIDDITNFNEVKNEILNRLIELKENPLRNECPKIYHLDVSSMYPNIMITNRLQPDSMITEAQCATCDFNRPGKTCDRRLPWSWRGEYYPPKLEEYLMVKNSLVNDTFPGRTPKSAERKFADLPQSERSALIRKRLADYSRKIYHKMRESETIEREAIICQRENPFYANTVRDFRDRRYEFKNSQKTWKKKLGEVKPTDIAAKEEAEKMIILYDSLQLAHKVILNSFYGYVMRKGSRWYSMEMAGVTCLTGATIIQMARKLIERVGRALELDTDGIWCIIPKSFPEDFKFETKTGKPIFISYPCVMLNHLVHDKFTNHQYQTLIDPQKFKYKSSSENSIFFEVDGPYRAMILPASKEEDKNLKKRYAVFNHDGSLAELKGFEVKRRGELQLIKNFQTQLFKEFLKGSTLEECYQSVAHIANQWLDVIESKGSTLPDSELIALICENRSMSKSLDEYGAQKSTSISTAKRLSEFLGEAMVKDKGLACKFIISHKPVGAPVTERAIPVAIFSADEKDKLIYLSRWLKDPSLNCFDPREILDWDYYKERLGSVIQKLITIPAALQRLSNPVPRISHPDWLQRRIITGLDKNKQSSLSAFISKPSINSSANNIKPITTDIEDFGKIKLVPNEKIARVVTKRKSDKKNDLIEDQVSVAILPDKMPSPLEDYVNFLAYQKLKWKHQRDTRVRRKHLFGDHSGNTNKNSLKSMFRAQSENIYTDPWEVIQIRETKSAGELRASVIINRKIHHIKLQVSKIVYVNFVSEFIPEISLPECNYSRVNFFLPNGHRPSNLFRFMLPEDVFNKEMARSNSFFKHPSIEGVYETKIDAVTRAIMYLGNKCRVNMEIPGALGKGLERGFSLDTLISLQNSTYLKASHPEFIFFYHLTSANRDVYALIPSGSKDRAFIFVYDPSRVRTELPNMNTIYEEKYLKMFTARKLDEDIVNYNKNVKFEISYSNNATKLFKQVEAILVEFSRGTSIPIIVLASSKKRKILTSFPLLKNFPILLFRLPQSRTVLPTLNWNKFASNIIIKQFLSLGSWISYLTALSRHSNIPLCNLKFDDVRYLIDISYARRLIEANIVLWWSSNALPDHGGHENDDVLSCMRETQVPEVNKPGSYSNSCIEVSISRLICNTILTSTIIDSEEGTEALPLLNETDSELIDVSNRSGSFLDSSFPVPAATVLRDMVRDWQNDFASNRAIVDNIIDKLTYWVSSPGSMLYDNSLRYHIENLTRKTYFQLVGVFKKLGSEIVYASKEKIILLTSKPSIENVYAYGQYIIKTILEVPQFMFLGIEVNTYWDYLLWLDQYNYAGVGCNKFNSNGEYTLCIFKEWQLQTFLPYALQDEFEYWVLKLVEKLHQLKTGSEDLSTPRLTQINQKQGTEVLTETKNIIAELKVPLLKRIKQLNRQQRDPSLSSKARSEFEFPELPGSYLKMTNPTLELVKAICGVYLLVKEADFPVRILRREMLKIFDVKEFSAEGAFKNPSHSLVLNNFTCSNCFQSRDLDLCRDESLFPRVLENGQLKYVWQCNNCSTNYHKHYIEEELIGKLMKLIISYQMQDLACSKCRKIKPDNLSEHCICSGEWVETMNRNELYEKIGVYKQVGKFYGLEMLINLIATVYI